MLVCPGHFDDKIETPQQRSASSNYVHKGTDEWLHSFGMKNYHPKLYILSKNLSLMSSILHHFRSSGHLEPQSLHSQKVLKCTVSHDMSGRAVFTSITLLPSRWTFAAVSALHSFTSEPFGEMRSAMSLWSSCNWRGWMRIGSFITRHCEVEVKVE